MLNRIEIRNWASLVPVVIPKMKEEDCFLFAIVTTDEELQNTVVPFSESLELLLQLVIPAIE